MNYSRKVLFLVGLILSLFTITMIVIFLIKGSIPDTLVTCVFAACTGEFSVLGWIKITKEKQRRYLEGCEDEDKSTEEDEIINEESEDIEQ